MRKFKFRYTLRNGQTGSGEISAPRFEGVGMLIRERFNLHDDVRIYDVKEVHHEIENTNSGPAETGSGC